MSVKVCFDQPLRRKNISMFTNTQNRNLQQNKWSQTAEGKVTTSDNKIVVPKRNFYNLLCEAHTATAHRGRDKTKIHKELLHRNLARCY